MECQKKLLADLAIIQDPETTPGSHHTEVLSLWLELELELVGGLEHWECHHYGDYMVIIHMDYRRKFRSQTYDNMDRWKAE